MNSSNCIKHGYESPLVFRPYFAQMYFAVFFSLASLIMLLCLFLIPISGAVGGALFVLAFALLALAMPMYKQSRLSVKISTEGVELSNGRLSFRALWEEFAVVYYLFDSKGHTYMLFATDEMDLRCRRAIIKQTLSIDVYGAKLEANGNVFLRVDGYRENICSIIGNRLPFVNVAEEYHGI